MSSNSPSPLDLHGAALNQHGAVTFLEHTPVGVAHLLLTLLRYKCVLAMVTSIPMVVGSLSMWWIERADSSALMMLAFGLVAAVFGLGAWAAYAIFGWLRRRFQHPPARVLELSRFGLRVSAQCDPTTVGGPLTDPFGRALIPWTAWSDVSGDAIVDGTLSFTLYAAPGRVDLALTPVRATEARDLARALWAEAHRPVG